MTLEQSLQDAEPAIEGAEAVYRIWPGAGAPTGSEDWDWQERTIRAPWAPQDWPVTRNVTTPTVTVFRPAPSTANGTSLLIAPGGAFHFLMMKHEGYDLARWAAERGVTAFVLKYRLARTPDDDNELAAFRDALGPKLGTPARDATEPPDRDFLGPVRGLAEEDGRQAIRFVRQNAAEWGLDPARIGIIGFSAGGGVAMGAVFQHDAQSRPDFAASIYAAWRRGATVPETAPPLFVLIADDDTAIAPLSSVRLYEQWHKAGIPAELHIFGSGAHGFGTEPKGALSDGWLVLFGNWLAAQGLIAKG